MTEIIQADREAAAEYFEMTNDAMRADFARCGNYDLSVCVQAFARHREQEVAKIVAWLREEAAQTRPFDYEIADIWESRADAIEAGEYRNG